MAIHGDTWQSSLLQVSPCTATWWIQPLDMLVQAKDEKTINKKETYLLRIYLGFRRLS